MEVEGSKALTPFLPLDQDQDGDERVVLERYQDGITPQREVPTAGPGRKQQQGKPDKEEAKERNRTTIR